MNDPKQQLEMAINQTVDQSMQARQRLLQQLDEFDQYLRSRQARQDKGDQDDDEMVKQGWRLPWQR